MICSSKKRIILNSILKTFSYLFLSITFSTANIINVPTNKGFSILKSEFVTLKIYNLLGQEVATMVSDKLTPGNYKYTWDASDFASGVYYYRLETNNGFVQTRKLILIK